MHVNQKSIRKSQAKAIVQALKRHISHNKEQGVAQILTQGKIIQKQLDMQGESKDISPQNNRQHILQKWTECRKQKTKT